MKAFTGHVCMQHTNLVKVKFVAVLVLGTLITLPTFVGGLTFLEHVVHL